LGLDVNYPYRPLHPPYRWFRILHHRKTATGK
jgi:hypothetical protein